MRGIMWPRAGLEIQANIFKYNLIQMGKKTLNLEYITSIAKKISSIIERIFVTGKNESD